MRNVILLVIQWEIMRSTGAYCVGSAPYENCNLFTQSPNLHNCSERKWNSGRLFIIDNKCVNVMRGLGAAEVLIVVWCSSGLLFRCNVR